MENSDTSADTGALDQNTAADAFGAFVGDMGDGEDDQARRAAPEAAETPEAAAERLLVTEAGGDAPPEGDAPEGDEKITIEVDGKPVQLTKAELAEHYKNGLRQADYTKKTMDVADLRKTADAETQKARSDRAAYAQKLHDFSVQTNAQLQDMSQVNLQELLTTDPMAYLEHQRIASQRQADLAKAQSTLGELTKEYQAEQAAENQAHRATQQQELIAKLPEWADPVKAKAESGAIKAYLLTQGFDEAKIGAINDHRDICMHRKAMLYDALIARAGEATKKITALPQKVERPGTAESGKPDGRTTAMKRLEKSGSISDAASVFESMFS